MWVAICDDDEATRRGHRAVVARVGADQPFALSVSEYATGEQLLFAVGESEFDPDIILLDVHMPGMDGVETARALRTSGYDGCIIFTSTSSRRVFDALDVGAFNYVPRAHERGTGRLERALRHAIEHAQQRGRRCILLNGAFEHLSLPVDVIRYIEVKKHVCTAHYHASDSFDFTSSLARVEAALAPYGFVRIQRSYVVNCTYVERYAFRRCVLDDGTVLPVGRQRYAALRAAMESRLPTELGQGG